MSRLSTLNNASLIQSTGLSGYPSKNDFLRLSSDGPLPTIITGLSVLGKLSKLYLYSIRGAHLSSPGSLSYNLSKISSNSLFFLGIKNVPSLSNLPNLACSKNDAP